MKRFVIPIIGRLLYMLLGVSLLIGSLFIFLWIKYLTNSAKDVQQNIVTHADDSPFYVNFDKNLSDNKGKLTNISHPEEIIYGNGIAEKAAKFAGQDSYAEYSCTGVFNKDQGTVMAWIDFDNLTKSDAVIWHTDDSAYVLYYDYASNDTLKRLVARAGGEQYFADYAFQQTNTTPTPFSYNVWHQVAMTWTGAPEGIVKIYVDGELRNSVPYKNGHDCKTFRIGNNYWLGLNWGDGYIDELKIFEKELSPDEIKKEYTGYTEQVVDSISKEINRIQDYINNIKGK